MPAIGSRMEWQSGNAPPPYPLYDSYRHPHDHRAPPTPGGPPPPPYHGYPPHGAPPQARSHQEYWYEQQQQQQLRPGYGPPPMHASEGGGPPPQYHGEGRQGPPPPPSHGPPRGYVDNRMPMNTPYGAPPPPDSAYYRRERPSGGDMMYSPHGMMQQQPYRTPPPPRRDTAAVVQTSSFSSKEDAPQSMEEFRERDDWEPSDAQDDGQKKQGDPLSLLAKVSSAMAPPRSRKGTQASEHEGQESKNEARVSVSVRSPTKAGTSSPLQRCLRSSPIITPNSAIPQPPRHVPPHVREAHPGGNTVTPKPITPTGTNYYGPPPPRPPHQGYEDPRGGPPGYSHYGMPPRGSYGPPSGSYSSGYGSRAGSWEQPQAAPPAVVEERNSFDSVESYGPPRYNYPPDYARSGGNRYPPYPPPPMEGWHPEQQRSGGTFGSPRWAYEQGPPRYGPPQQQQQRGPPPPYPPQHYYDDRGGVSPYQRPSPPPGYAPYSYVQQPSLDEKTVLRKKFSWKHFPELERFLIDNRDDYLKYSSRNYTVEQKQFNNMLTERLIELAEKHSYVFDPEEFNFVSIRDRIRCYYKSYVQTARKRGLMLPTDKVKTDKDKKDTDEQMHSEDAETLSHGDDSTQDKEERE